MGTVDFIPAPAADAVTFRMRRGRMFLKMACIFAPIWLVVRGALMLVTTVRGNPPDTTELVAAALSAVIIPLAGATGAGVGAGRHLGFVRASAAGLEFAATRHMPVFLPWAAVRSVRLRFRGPLTELVVAPTELSAATVAPLTSRRPRVSRWSGSPAFLVDVGMMTPEPAVLLAELDRRLTTGPPATTDR